MRRIGSGTGRATAAVRRAVARSVHPDRLLLAARAAVAATIAWIVGNQLPGGLDEYAYYAPFGTILALTGTVAESVRSGVQTLVGLAAGIGLAWGLIALGTPGLLAAGAAAGLGVLVSGLLRAGAARDILPVAAFFVLVLGGRDPDGFSSGYLVQVALGIAIGTLATVIVPPPLLVRDADDALAAARRSAAEHLDALAAFARREAAPEPDALRERADAYRHLLDRADAAVRDADESRRGNPRSRLTRYDFAEDVADLTTLRRLGRHLWDLGDALGLSDDGSALDDAVELRDPTADALDAAAALVREWDGRPGGGAASEAAIGVADDADAAIEALAEARRSAAGAPRGTSSIDAAIVSLRRLTGDVRSRLHVERAAG
jgi:uncharacterized membrane protein YccC